MPSQSQRKWYAIAILAVLVFAFAIYFTYSLTRKGTEKNTAQVGKDTDGDGIPDIFVTVKISKIADKLADAITAKNVEQTEEVLWTILGLDVDVLQNLNNYWDKRYTGKDGILGYFAWKNLSTTIAELNCDDPYFYLSGTVNIKDCNLKDNVADRLNNLI